MSNYVTEALGRALLDLMREKSIEKITVDELTTRAKLGRATYFRNFNAKEEIITQYIVMRWRAYEKAHRLKEHRIDDPYRVRRYFEFCLSMRADNDVIMRQNRSSAILSAYEIIFYPDSVKLTAPNRQKSQQEGTIPADNKEQASHPTGAKNNSRKR